MAFENDYRNDRDFTVDQGRSVSPFHSGAADPNRRHAQPPRVVRAFRVGRFALRHLPVVYRRTVRLLLRLTTGPSTAQSR